MYTKQKAAEAQLFAAKKEAEGMAALAQAKGYYLQTLLKQLGGNYSALRDFLMIEKDVFQDIAKSNAQAVKGLQPKISIWTNGKNGGGELENGGISGGALKDVAGLYGMLPPLLQTVQEQTGMTPPAWLGSLPAPDNSDRSDSSAIANVNA